VITDIDKWLLNVEFPPPASYDSQISWQFSKSKFNQCKSFVMYTRSVTRST